MDARTLVEALLPAIGEIDGGCTSCVREFVGALNAQLALQGLDFAVEVGQYGKEDHSTGGWVCDSAFCLPVRLVDNST